MDFENLRFYVKIRTILGINATDIHKELQLASDEHAPSYSFVVKWIDLFRAGREDVNDAHRIGRPITETNNANIDLVRMVIKQDPFVTYDNIEAETSLSCSTIHTRIFVRRGRFEPKTAFIIYFKSNCHVSVTY